MLSRTAARWCQHAMAASHLHLCYVCVCDDLADHWQDIDVHHATEDATSH